MKIKKILNSIWDEFVYGGHLLSLGAASIVFTSAILLNIRITWDCLVIVYLGTEAVYLYNRFREFKKDYLTNPQRTQHIKQYVKYILLAVFLMAFSAIAIVVYFNKLSILIFGFLLFCAGLLYSEFFKRFTKRIPAFKDFFVSLAWSLLVIFLAFYYSLPLSSSVLLILIFVYLKLFIHESASDIKDIEGDKKENLLTLPIVVGKKKLLNVLYGISLFSTIPIILGFYLKLFPQSSLMLLFTIPYTFYYLKKLKEEKNANLLYSVIIDGEYILWSIFILLGETLL